jgi:hypothetical protein
MQVEILRMISAHDRGLAVGYAAAGYAAIRLATVMIRRVWAG